MVNGRLKRRKDFKPQRALFLIVGEGEVTEKEYFDILSEFCKTRINVKYVTPKKHHGGNCKALVQTMNDEIKAKSDSLKQDENWIVADIEDPGKSRDITPLITWCDKASHNYLGLTNPQFENWLLLHFQKGMSSNDPIHNLTKYIPAFKKNNKHIRGSIDITRIKAAIQNAKGSGVVVPDTSNNKSTYEINNCTSISHLVAKLIEM